MAGSISTGIEALHSVAKEAGLWNWVLVGADPKALPLAGGGSGGVEEMSACLTALGDAVLGGLLRVEFCKKASKQFTSKWVMVFITLDGENTMSAVLRGKANAKRGCMEKAIGEYCKVVSGTMQITHLEDFALDSVIALVKKSAIIDGEYVRPEYFPPEPIDEEALREGAPDEPVAEAPAADATETCEFVESVPQSAAPEEEEEVAEDEEEKAVEAAVVQVEDLPEAPAEASEDAAAAASQEAASQEATGGYVKTDAPEAAASKPKRREGDGWFKQGDFVDIFSESEKKWFTDGVIEEIRWETSTTPDGKTLPEGCAKVVYSNGQRGKWLHPDVLYNKNVVQASIKPTSFKGFLKKETHNILSEWHVRYFELRNGYLSWWITVDDAKKGVKPQCTLELVGLELKVATSSALLSIRTASSRGVVYNFDAKTGPLQSPIDDWLAAFKQHAAFANRMYKFKRNSQHKA